MENAVRALRRRPAGRVSAGLAVFPPLTLLLFLGPILAGLAGTLLPAFGWLPALGGQAISFEPWRALLAEPGVGRAVLISLTVGLGSTALALALTLAILIALYDRPAFRSVQRLLAPALAVPHAAFAIGFAFLLAPSGWLARLASPWLTGWDLPPDLMILQDPNGLALMAVLTIKETFFLLLVSLAALGQIDAGRRLTVARVMGYRPAAAWLKAVLPALYPQIRLPVYAVLATGLSIVDVALIVGPTAPPPLAVLLFDWFRDFDLGLRFTAAAGAVLQLLLAAVAIGLWRLGEKMTARLARAWLVNGGRGGGRAARLLRLAGGAGAALVYGSTALALAVLALWALSGVWRWPNALPEALSLDTLVRAAPLLGRPFLNTLLVGLASTALALLLVIGSLEYEVRSERSIGRRGLLLLYLPLLLPQIGFLFGVQVMWITLGWDGGLPAVAWTHLLFVLPFVYLALADPYRTLDPRIARSARSLGASPLRVLLCVKLPLLIRPLMTALAIGFAVSVAQYLPTVFAGGGRTPTLTTEAVALAAGADRRLLGVFAFLQALLPLAVFTLALALPGLLARNRRGLAQ